MRNNEKRISEINHVMGRVFKKFRSNRHFTLSDAASEGTSTSVISSFERGETKLSAPALFNALQNINVNSYEFQYACNERLEQKDVLLFDIDVTRAYMDSSIPKLRKLLKSTEREIKLNPNKKKFRFDKIRIEGTLCLIDHDYEPEKDDVTFIKNYFMGLKVWCIEDIRLYGQCLSLFDSNTLDDLTQKFIELTKTVSQLHFTKLTIIRTFLNLIDRSLEIGNFKEAHQCIIYLDNINIHEYYMFEKLTLIYNKAKLNYLETRNEKSLDTMNRCKEIMKFCNCSKTEIAMEDEIAEILEVNN
ncbi:MAG: hypothetical protein LBV19_06485 [Streptococcaceae bacterium]|jgi:Rgg/GadR/MutR family transcriptional activator|nr:hypothetical protein [Streptococcaceae bacterium]